VGAGRECGFKGEGSTSDDEEGGGVLFPLTVGEGEVSYYVRKGEREKRSY